jgi:hypothetical protein
MHQKEGARRAMPSIPSLSALAGGDGGTPLLRPETATVWWRDGHVEAYYRLSAAHDPYLCDLCFDGHPVLPAAVALELMLEVVAWAWPARPIVRVADLRVLRGVVLTPLRPLGPAVTLSIVARPQADQTGAVHSVEISMGSPAARGRLHGQPHYRCTAILAGTPAAAPPAAAPAPARMHGFPLSIRDAYRRWLFHGPLLQGIMAIQGVGEGGITALLTPSLPRHLVASPGAGAWQIDPVVLDSTMQLAALWTRHTMGMTALPTSLGTYHRLDALAEPMVRCEMRVASNTCRGALVCANAWLLGAGGRLVGMVEHAEYAASTVFNRLAGGAATP